MDNSQREKRNLDIAADLQAGEHISTVMSKYNVRSDTIYKICRRFDIVRKTEKSHVRTTMIVLYQLLYTSKTYEEIARSLNLTKGRISQLSIMAKEVGFEITRN